jgi:hypothetical protein
VRAAGGLAGVAAIAAAGALAGAGCLESKPAPVTGSDGDFYDPGPDAGGPTTRLDAAAVDGAGADADTAAWAGTWAFTSGGSGLDCDGSFSVSMTTGVLVIAAAQSNHLTVQSSGCTFAFAVSGDVATTDPPDQACALWAVPTIPIWTLTLRADGTMAEKLGGQVWVDGEQCDVSGSATLARQ